MKGTHTLLKRKLMAVFAATAMLLTFAPTVSAASYGPCADGSGTAYLSGNQQTSVAKIKTIQAELKLPGSAYFTACTGSPSGGDGPTVLISMHRVGPAVPAQAWVQAGITRCYGSHSICTGTPRLFSEWHDGITGASAVRDLGPASYNTTYLFTINSLGEAGEVNVLINGSFETKWVTGSQLQPGDDPWAYWLTETHDTGDSLGTSGNATNIGAMTYYVKDVGWYNRSANCNFTGSSSQIECRNNGAYGQYFYTVN